MITHTPALFHALASIPVLTGISPEAQVLLAGEGIEGDVEVVKHADSPRAVTLATLRRGTFFGEMCIVEPMPRAASVLTLSPVKAIEIKAATLYHLFKQMPDQYSIVLLNLARDMARRLRQLDEAYAARAT